MLMLGLFRVPLVQQTFDSVGEIVLKNSNFVQIAIKGRRSRVVGAFFQHVVQHIVERSGSSQPVFEVVHPSVRTDPEVPPTSAGECHVIHQTLALQGGQGIANRTFTGTQKCLNRKKIALCRCTDQKVGKHSACHGGESIPFEECAYSLDFCANAIPFVHVCHYHGTWNLTANVRRMFWFWYGRTKFTVLWHFIGRTEAAP